MITCPVAQLQRPVVDMYMLHLHLSLTDRLADENMVQLFILIVEDICVSLHDGYIGYFIDFEKDIVEWSEDGTRLNKFVVVPSYDKAGPRIKREKCLGECLK